MKLPRDVEEWAKKIPTENEIYPIDTKEWIDGAVAIIENKHKKIGYGTPWKAFNDVLTFRPGESTLWAGANGSGKTQFLAQLTAFWALQNQSVVSLSLEMRPAAQIARLAKIVYASETPDEKQIYRLTNLFSPHVWIADYQGVLSVNFVTALALFCARELRLNHFVLDNLTQLISVGRDGDGAMQEFVGRLHQIGNQYGTCMHLVAHIKKPEDRKRVPDRYDIRGTGSAPDQVDNVCMIWRNEPKEDDRSQGKDYDRDAPDNVIRIDKQREGGERGLIPFFYIPKCGQFVRGYGPATPMID